MLGFQPCVGTPFPLSDSACAPLFGLRLCISAPQAYCSIQFLTLYGGGAGVLLLWCERGAYRPVALHWLAGMEGQTIRPDLDLSLLYVSKSLFQPVLYRVAFSLLTLKPNAVGRMCGFLFPVANTVMSSAILCVVRVLSWHWEPVQCSTQQVYLYVFINGWYSIGFSNCPIFRVFLQASSCGFLTNLLFLPKFLQVRA